ncbi:primosomal protein N' [Cyanobium sp. HWJ4-Hawea]|uniref:replication restart helicase PriA n=1 Tax=Cyanobium sp. HWJ4-Hawea TaxID=2823713 RepID=UPI0020CF89E7|nr:primosomal protein N' [Cyanobium sp. HWJ4-Hawea]MCP9810174.1 primosomal protein N' [Cyanobium sp. HWJ4-Hawea]
MPSPWLQIWLEAGREGQVFTYLDPGGESTAGIGDLVRVRLQGKRHVGLVVEVLGQCPAELAGKTIQPIEGIVQRAAIDANWQKLMAAVASTCHTSHFKTLKTALPPGWLGQRRQAAEPNPRPRWQVSLAPTPDAAQAPGEAGSKLTAKQQELLDHLGLCPGPVPLAELCSGGWSRSVLTGLERRGLVKREPLGCGIGLGAQRSAEFLGAPAGARALTPAQQGATTQIAESISAGSQQFLLWGVTGAGKTEVYLQAAARALAEAKSVLLLTPEIGLIPQLLDRSRERFGPRVVEFHSGMADGARVAAWRRCLNEGPLVVVGTRSAIFLPLLSIGLIVLDEEHDSSYKQESPMPCYHARDVAQLRCRQEGATLVMGSATPSLESWLSCQGPNPTTKLLRLPERIGCRPLPAVRIIDMRQELVEGHRRLLSRALMGRLETLQSKGEQAVVLVPRRGYRAFMSCRSCGEAVMCPHCDVALTVHRRGTGQEWLRCHWCDHRAEVSSRCLHCGSTAFKPFGAGTQRVMEQLTSELADLRVLRFDRDTTRGRDGHRRLLDRFADGEADVLVGTQMLAKGMDLPRVTLAAVLAADGLLHRPDLRSSEQCLQLLLQLAGRAGRGEQPGEVLVQTYSPDHPVINHLVDGRYEAFLAEEINLRRQAGLMPFSRACLLRIHGPTASGTATAATSLAEQIRASVERAGWLLIGPAPAPVAKVAGKSRWQLLLHGPADSILPLPPEAELRQGLPAGIGLAIDPDPITL